MVLGEPVPGDRAGHYDRGVGATPRPPTDERAAEYEMG